MHFIGLLIVAFALFFNLKSYGIFFTSKKKKAEAEKKFVEALDKMEESPLGKQMTTGVMKASMGFTIFINFLFYLITTIIVNNPLMYALGVIIFLLNTFGIKVAVKSMVEKRLVESKANKISIPLKTVYIIGFLVLFFI